MSDFSRAIQCVENQTFIRAFLLNNNLLYDVYASFGIYCPDKGFSLHHQLRSDDRRCDMNIERTFDKTDLSCMLRDNRSDNLSPAVWESSLGDFCRYIWALEELVKELSDRFWVCASHCSRTFPYVTLNSL